MTTKYDQPYECSACNYVDVVSVTYQEGYDRCDAPCPSCNDGKLEKNNRGEAAGIGYEHNLRNKVPQGFHEVMSKVKQAHPHHRIDGELS